MAMYNEGNNSAIDIWQGHRTAIGGTSKYTAFR